MVAPLDEHFDRNQSRKHDTCLGRVVDIMKYRWVLQNHSDHVEPIDNFVKDGKTISV